jgi:hypothetical protein
MSERTVIVPPNSTQLEIDLANTIYDYLRANISYIRTLRGFRYGSIPTNLLTAVIEDLGLGDLTKYIQDPRQVIIDGQKWSLHKGTPLAFDIAMTWLFRNDLLIENSESWHWTNVEVYLQTPVEDRDELRNIIELTRASLPARATLSRVWAGSDIPAMGLNINSELNGSILNVPGGIWDEEFKLWLFLNYGSSTLFISDIYSTVESSSGIGVSKEVGFDDELLMFNGLRRTIGEVSSGIGVGVNTYVPRPAVTVSDILNFSKVVNVSDLQESFLSQAQLVTP